MTCGNLFRDQLDRYGEIETLANKWRVALDHSNSRKNFLKSTRKDFTLILNADDPAIASLLAGRSLAFLSDKTDSCH